ncbi:MAG: hypothetical protein HC855_04320 [Rhizobiales bacterium]|nr:hypothetical protein [Hyphomicrobiales bacterium]
MHTLILILHIMVIALGTGLSFSNLVNTRLAEGKSGEMAKGLGLQRMTIAKIGDGVIALIWITGLALLWLRGGVSDPWFHAKLAFVVLLTVSHAMARRTGGQLARTGNMALLSSLQLFIAGVFVSALASILFAMLAFHG